MFSLENKNLLITGGAGYLGSAITKACIKQGGRVFLSGRNAGKLETLAAEINLGNDLGRAVALPFDVCCAESTQQALDTISEGYGELHVIINNAYNGAGGNFETATDDNYRESYELAVVAAARLVRLALPVLSSNASVINVASMYGVVSPDPRIYESASVTNPPFYGASKAALVQMSRYMAVELGPRGIRVNTLVPGPFPSPKSQEKFPKMVEGIVNKVPMNRIGQAHELAGPAVFLASDASSYVTGSILTVDGGWTAW